MAALKYWVWLAALGAVPGPVKLQLLHHFGSPEGVYFADQDDYAHLEGIKRAHLDALEDKSLLEAEEILRSCAEKGVFVISMDDALYPSRLRAIFDAPLVLYGKGKMPLFDDEAAVTMVGSRTCTQYGIACGEMLGYELGRSGALVISGMARGIDSACLRGALRAGGFVCAVLAGGVDVVYPAENKYLYDDILKRGVILSEAPPGTRSEGWRFPLRNRIMSGLALGTVVVEAGEKSGALITAQNALEQGRDVFCVPGPITAAESRGCHHLIRQGACLVTGADHILEEYESRFPHKLRRIRQEVPPIPQGADQPPQAPAIPLPPSPKARPKVKLTPSQFTDDQIDVMRLLSTETPLLTDDIAAGTDLPIRRILSAVTMLEIDGYVEKTGAQSFVRLVDIEE